MRRLGRSLALPLKNANDTHGPRCYITGALGTGLALAIGLVHADRVVRSADGAARQVRSVCRHRRDRERIRACPPWLCCCGWSRLRRPGPMPRQSPKKARRRVMRIRSDRFRNPAPSTEAGMEKGAAAKGVPKSPWDRRIMLAIGTRWRLSAPGPNGWTAQRPVPRQTAQRAPQANRLN